MAERRMFTKKVTDDDNFMNLSSSAQALYLHLSMAADDDGFCNQVTLSMFKAHASVQDLEALLKKSYIIQFDNGVIVIKHWRMANAIRKDRYSPTAFQEQLRQLGVKENGSYTLCKSDGLPDGCQVVDDRLPQDRSVKDSPVKGSRKEKADVFSDFSGDDAELLSALKDFEKMRKENDRPMSDRAKSMLLNKLQTFPRNEWIKILEQSIFHCWQGIFPLKDDGNTFTGSKTSKTAEMLSDSYNMMKEWATDDSKS